MKTYLLGCGAQKAGTTWLANQLNSSPEYWNGGIKEWRFWNCYFDSNHKSLQLRKMNQELYERSKHERRLNNPKFKWRFSALQSPESFLRNISDEFAANEYVKVMGDMTPINGTLGTDELAFIKEYFSKRSIVVKPLLIMRDSFERIWSAVRMKVGNLYPEQYRQNERLSNNTLIKSYRSETVDKRTRYEHTIEKLENIFGISNICYEFSEEGNNRTGLNLFDQYYLSDKSDGIEIKLTRPEWVFSKSNSLRSKYPDDFESVIHIRRGDRAANAGLPERDISAEEYNRLTQAENILEKLRILSCSKDNIYVMSDMQKGDPVIDSLNSSEFKFTYYFEYPELYSLKKINNYKLYILEEEIHRRAIFKVFNGHWLG